MYVANPFGIVKNFIDIFVCEVYKLIFVNLMTSLSNSIIWKQFLDGDDKALAALFKEYSSQLYSYGLKIANDEHLVKDCIQEVFIQLIDKRHTIKVTSTTHIYLFKSLRNKIFEETRSHNRKQNILSWLGQGQSAIENDVEQKLIDVENQSDLQLKIKTAIKHLSSRQQEVIFLKFTEGFSYDEIANLLSIDKASARTLVYRSVKKIKDSLLVDTTDEVGENLQNKQLKKLNMALVFGVLQVVLKSSVMP